MNIRLASKLGEDYMAWFHEKTGVFSVRSAYRLAGRIKKEENGGWQSTSLNQDQRPIWKNFWNIPIPHKILVFGWKVINNGLATQNNKCRRNIEVSD
jgi:hypothetical protein